MMSALLALRCPRQLARRAVLGALAAGITAMMVTGCAESACERDSDCPRDYLCATNKAQNRCVPDPYAGMQPQDAGIDGGDGGNVQPSTCDSSTDTFDPGAVYLLGSVPGTGCSPNAVAALASPDVESVGFGCGVDARSAAIRPSDGRLVYLDAQNGRLLTFSKDAHAYDTTSSTCTYPANPAANDQVIPTTGCNAAGKPSGFLFAPDAEGIWYTCTNPEGIWFDENHDDVEVLGLGARTPLLRGYGGALLAAPGAGLDSPRSLLLVSSGGNEVGIGSSLPEESTLLAMRALDDGFWIALRNDGEGAIERLLVGLDGSVQPAGTYPALPAGVSFDGADVGYVMDASGALYAVIVDQRQGTSFPGVARLVPDGSATVVYTEADAPEVTMDGAALVTAR